jgi:hypothetical protein
MLSTAKTARWSVITLFLVSLVLFFSANIHNTAFGTDKNLDKLDTTNKLYDDHIRNNELLSKLSVNEPGKISHCVLPALVLIPVPYRNGPGRGREIIIKIRYCCYTSTTKMDR